MPSKRARLREQPGRQPSCAGSTRAGTRKTTLKPLGYIRSDEWPPLSGQDRHFNGLTVVRRALTVGGWLKEDEAHFPAIRSGKG